MYKTDLKDETFNINNSKQYKLFLQFSSFSFSYAIFDTQRNKHVLLRNTLLKNNKPNSLEKLNEILTSDEILQLEFEQIKAILLSAKSIFIPKPLFEKNKISEILNFNTTINKSEVVLFDELKNDIYNIYAFDKKIHNQLNNKFPKIKIYNQGSVLLSSNIHKKKSIKKKLIIDVNTSFFEILLIENNELIFRNTFKFTNETDFVFYVISIIERFKLDNENDEVNISGTITSNSKETELLRKYIKKIRFRRTESNYSYVFNDIDISTYTNLLNLQHCE